MKIRDLFFWVLALNLLTSFNAHSSDALKNAWTEIKNKNFVEAQSILSNQLKQQPSDIETRFLYARALAWGGKFSESIKSINLLLEKHPNNADYALFKARVLNWQEKNVLAIDILTETLLVSPKYFAVWELQYKLLKQTYLKNDSDRVIQFHKKFKQQFPNKKIQPLIVKPDIKKQFIIATSNYRFLNKNKKNGYGLAISYGNTWKKYQIIASTHSKSHLNRKDQSFNLAATRKIQSNIWLNSGLGTSTQQTIFPLFSAFAKADYLTQNKWLGSYQITHQIYKNLTVDKNQISISKRWGKYEPLISINSTTIDYEDITLSLSTKFTYHFENKHMIRLSLNAGYELEYINELITIYEIRNITIDGKYLINQKWHFIYALSHHIQGTAYTQNGILSGLQFRF